MLAVFAIVVYDVYLYGWNNNPYIIFMNQYRNTSEIENFTTDNFNITLSILNTSFFIQNFKMSKASSQFISIGNPMD